MDFLSAAENVSNWKFQRFFKTLTFPSATVERWGCAAPKVKRQVCTGDLLETPSVAGLGLNLNAFSSWFKIVNWVSSLDSYSAQALL